MPPTFQDDDRENEAIRLFDLTKDEDEGRSGIDAHLTRGDTLIPFELKTTSKGSVTTVRDFGPDHVEKWRGKHWLIGFYMPNQPLYYHYGSPSAMSPWIEGKWEYIRPDFLLAELTPDLITSKQMVELLGAKETYSLSDAKKIQKKQLAVAEYRSLMDRGDGYSPGRMLEILQMRAGYLMKRGSTLNNPHIPMSYFDGWAKIEIDHAARLRELVEEYFGSL